MKNFLIFSCCASAIALMIASIGNYLSELPRPEPSSHKPTRRHYDPGVINDLADRLVNLCRPSLMNPQGCIRLPLNWSFYQTKRDYTPFELEKLRRALNCRLEIESDVRVSRVQQEENYFIIRLFD